jgi:hypothetical protein
MGGMCPAQTGFITKAKYEGVIENSVRCVSARYDVQTLTIPALSQARQALGCVTTGSTCHGRNTARLLNVKSVMEPARRLTR